VFNVERDKFLMTANRLISILVVVHQRLLLLHRPRMVTYVANSP